MNAVNHRRSFLSGVACLPLAIAGSSTPALSKTSAKHPDAELLALGREWQVRVDNSEALGNARFAIDNKLDLPEPPEALFRRDRDFLIFFGFKGSQRWCPELGSYRWWYGEAESIAHLSTGNLCREDQPLNERDLARIAEILQAYAAWRRDVDRIERDSGLTAAAASHDAEVNAEEALRNRIARFEPVRTLEGAAVKAKVALWCMCATLEEANHDLALDLENTPVVSSDLMAMILARDLVRMTAAQASREA